MIGELIDLWWWFSPEARLILFVWVICAIITLIDIALEVWYGRPAEIHD